MKPELLSPAGNMEALKAAIHGGADAVYIGGKDFGARFYAENFTESELSEAIKYAHLYDVKIYVTANTIVYQDETQNFVEYIKSLYLMGADAVIMQDIGMIKLIHKLIPDLKIHASTQANNCNDEVLKLYKSLGVTKVVLARELSLDQINNLKTDIEKEIFIHGALCVCYSGCCLFSSLNGGRSGNRGKCAGPCRLPYTLIKNGKVLKTKGSYLLSTKELNVSKQMNKILKSNVQSLKIEGQMKSPEYVYFVTKMYRDLIDKHYTSLKDNDLKKLFNRKFTEGHLFNKQNERLMNQESPNHIGLEIGKVLKTGKKIMIKLSDNLAQNDGIRFKNTGKGFIVGKLYNSKGLLINKAYKNDIVYLDNKINLKNKDILLKTTDYKLTENLKKYPLKTIFINFKIEAFVGKEIVIIIYNDNYKISQKGNIVESAITSPTTKENIINQLSKLGDTPFTLNKIDINMDENIFIPLKELNELRRKVIQKLIDEKTKITRNLKNINISPSIQKTNHDLMINVLVRNEKQLKAVINKANYIYTDDYNLYFKYKNKNVFFRTNRTNYNLPDFKNENLLLTNLGDIYKYPKINNCLSDYFLNISNSYSIDFLKKNMIKQITISPELSISRIKEVLKYNNNVELIIYGTLELMVMNHCLIKMNDKCPNCKDNSYFLKNRKNELFPIISKNCQTHIMHHNKINLINNLNELRKSGLNSVRLELFDESKEEILSIFNHIKSSLQM